MPLHQTLGISGAEVYFDHPDKLWHALAVALPFLSESAGVKTREFVARQMKILPPFAVEGFEGRMGQPRESYDVPKSLRRSARGHADSAFGVYAFWLWCHAADDQEAKRTHWADVRARMEPLVEQSYAFDIAKRDYRHNEAQKLNGDLAGLLGFVRLARANDDSAIAELAARRLTELVQLRVNLERTNPQILEKTDASTKALHNVRLARYGGLGQELAVLLARRTDGLAAARVRLAREARNGWFLALGDRFVGGENYTSPLHFTHALFTGAALLEKLPGERLLQFVDVPACRADFFFIEKCALALERASD